jgi:uncharacterized RDD family membrane protein YckC
MIGPATAPPGRLLLAPHHLRLFAFLLDYLTIIAGLKLAEQIFLGDGWDLRMAAEATRVFPLWWIVTTAGLFLSKDVLGASLGKWVLGISVRRRDRPHTSPPPWRAVARNLSLVLLPADLYSLFCDAQLRRFGDRWFGTVVVVRDPALPVVGRAFGLGSLFLGFILAALLVTSWNLRRTSAYQVAQQAVASQQALVSQLGAPVEFDRSPSMDLRLDQGLAMLVIKAKGGQRSAEVRVRLVLMRTLPPKWLVGSIDISNPPSETPLVRDAPRQK